VTRTKLSRSKKTSRSKGYGFVEFADREIAKIAAQAMNGYFLFGK
jgi:nucleolar protein 15